MNRSSQMICSKEPKGRSEEDWTASQRPGTLSSTSVFTCDSSRKKGADGMFET